MEADSERPRVCVMVGHCGQWANALASRPVFSVCSTLPAGRDARDTGPVTTAVHPESGLAAASWWCAAARRRRCW